MNLKHIETEDSFFPTRRLAVNRSTLVFARRLIEQMLNFLSIFFRPFLDFLSTFLNCKPPPGNRTLSNSKPLSIISLPFSRSFSPLFLRHFLANFSIISCLLLLSFSCFCLPLLVSPLFSSLLLSSPRFSYFSRCSSSFCVFLQFFSFFLYFLRFCLLLLTVYPLPGIEPL